MKQIRKMRRNIRIAIGFTFLAGIMSIYGNGIIAKASEDYGTLINEATGVCGTAGNEENVTWAVYDSNQDEDDIGDTLVLGGSGEMENFTSDSPSPWASYNSNIKTVIFAEGCAITNIGDYAFKNCINLSDFTIPEKVTEIGNGAFKACNNLRNVTIPEGVTRIEEYAFFGCNSLSNIVIPEGVTSIGGYAFSGCNSLNNIVIPKGVTSIGEAAFYKCSNLSSVVIQEGITRIEDYTFCLCTNLSSVIISDDVTYIGEWAFNECGNLSSIVIPEEVTGIGKNIFRYCSSLSSIIIPPKVTEIGMSAFEKCSDLQEIYYPDIELVKDAKIPDTSSQISYVINPNNTVSLKVEKLSGDTKNITLPEMIYGNYISSIEGIEDSDISISCTKHYPATGDWQIKKEAHSFIGCSVCKEESEIKENHEYGDGTQACRCGYVPFKITAHPQEKIWAYGVKSDEERKLSVEVQATIGDENIKYQWYENGCIVEGATESVYVVPKNKSVNTYQYYCKVSCGGYSLKSDIVTVSVTKAQGMIQAEENIILTYSKEPVVLEGITKIGEGNLKYAVTEGEEIVSVTQDGEVTLMGVGMATISINMEETVHYTQAETKNITVTVGKADYPAITPDAPMAVANTVKKVSEVFLPDNWEWESEDAKKTLPAGKELEVTANYTGDDKEFYYNTFVKVTLKRAACTSSGILYTGEGEKAPTCTEEGKGHRECTACEDILESDITVPVVKHKLSKVSKKEPGCTTTGKEAHFSCSECKKLFTDEQGSKEVTEKELIIPETNHTGGEADCTKKAVCTVCKKEYGELDKSKHGETEIKNAKEATCTEVGYTGDTYCKACENKVASGKETAILAHDLSKVAEETATCETEGRKLHYSCKNCKKLFADEQGSKEVTEKELVIPETNHTGGEADCTKKAVCTECQKEYGELDKSRHSETEVKNAKEATCTEAGYTGDTYCKVCGEKVSFGTEIEVLGHTGGEADCTKKAVCTECQKEYGELDKSKHSETEVKNIKDTTCKENGYTGDVCCKDCGEIITAGKVTEKLSHVWDKGVVTKEATETEKGIKIYTCSGCQETKTEEIPATGKVVTPEKPGTVTPTPSVKPGEVITPEKPGTVTPIPTVKPTEKPSKEEQKTPKKGTILTDKKSNGKYKILVAGKNGTVEYVRTLSKKSTKANIPATVKINGITYKVVSIAKNAFKNNKSITKITIGKNVKIIGSNAFYGCKKLKTVSMGKNVTSIGNKSFYKCTALTKITIPSKVKEIGKHSFYGCKKLKTIIIKTTKFTKKNVGSKAFTGIYKKATIKVPKSKVKAYQKLLRTKGISKSVKVKK